MKNLKNIIIRIKNYFGIQGTYSWALKQMKEGAFIKSDKLKTGYSLFYDFECNSLMVANGYQWVEIKSNVFASEYIHKLFLIDNFYISTSKQLMIQNTPVIKNLKLSWSEYFGITQNIFNI